MASNKRKYGLFNFIVDITLSLLTGGLWLIWIFCREMRR
ncbi:membrane protein [Gordonia Phage Odesza]|uniref:Membrane protein n=3 Tax=Tanisvirus tanis TaxID=2844677 RepID=A0A7D5JI30_9CAUD|nr:membrane protein [Gordonia phage Tanis]QGJ89684.1 membrane protein [Gordonia Phage Odesza]QKY78745.1 membrane protein [Gordonia phage Gill]QLF83791.1 membrane protein [Gordonia phage Magel]QYW00713.1 membrane protein [Gordonia phage Roney]QFP95650.1 membrane protein [Gordonia phage Tanis]